MANRELVGTPGQIKATSALLKFCQEHRHTPFWVQTLGECLDALKRKDRAAVEKACHLLTHGGMGSFLDWFPDVVFPNEDEHYVQAVWEGLNCYWYQMMRKFIRPNRASLPPPQE